MKTYVTRETDIKREKHVIDASGKVLGKIAVEAANLLMGKHKPIFTRNLDTGDSVIVINADKVTVTGNKLQQKLYYRHSGYPGGFRSVKLEKVRQSHPERVIRQAIKGMLPHNRLGASMMKKLQVYAGDPQVQPAQSVESSKDVKE